MDDARLVQVPQAEGNFPCSPQQRPQREARGVGRRVGVGAEQLVVVDGMGQRAQTRPLRDDDAQVLACGGRGGGLPEVGRVALLLSRPGCLGTGACQSHVPRTANSTPSKQQPSSTRQGSQGNQLLTTSCEPAPGLALRARSTSAQQHLTQGPLCAAAHASPPRASAAACDASEISPSSPSSSSSSPPSSSSLSVPVQSAARTISSIVSSDAAVMARLKDVACVLPGPAVLAPLWVTNVPLLIRRRVGCLPVAAAEGAAAAEAGSSSTGREEKETKPRGEVVLLGLESVST